MRGGGGGGGKHAETGLMSTMPQSDNPIFFFFKAKAKSLYPESVAICGKHAQAWTRRRVHPAARKTKTK